MIFPTCYSALIFLLEYFILFFLLLNLSSVDPYSFVKVVAQRGITGRSASSFVMAYFRDWNSSFHGDDSVDEEEDYGCGERMSTSDSPCQANPYEHGHDAVLCLIDFRLSMFQTSPNYDQAEVLPDGKGSSEECGTRVPSPGSITAFGMVARTLQQLRDDKATCNGEDMVALVLYNTRESSDSTFPGVYLLQTFQYATAHGLQELEELAAAATVPSAAYDDLERRIGHSVDDDCRLDDVFRVAQRMFAGLNCELIKHRRIFLFTNDANPRGGDLDMLEKCGVEVQALSSTGIRLICYIVNTANQLLRAAPQHPGELTAAGVCESHQCCDEGKFWLNLQGSIPKVEDIPFYSSIDIVHVGYDGKDTLEALSTAVWRRTHPQQSNHFATLTIGTSNKGSLPPKIPVVVYRPLVQAKFRTKGLPERRADEMSMLRQRAQGIRFSTSTLYPTGSDAPAPVYVKGKQQRLPHADVDTRKLPNVTEREKEYIIFLTTRGASVGFTIICCKSAEDVLQHQQVLGKAHFLYPNPQGGASAFRLFFQMTRELEQERKVAIAQYVKRHGGAPRLVALVPTGFDSNLGNECILPIVQGVGLHVVPMPFADDIRELPPLPCFTAKTEPKESDIHLARGVLSCLPTRYDVCAAPGPAVGMQSKTTEAVVHQRQAEAPSIARKQILHSQLSDGVDCGFVGTECTEPFDSASRKFVAAMLPSSYNAAEICSRSKGQKADPVPSLNSGDDEADSASSGDIVPMVEAAYRLDALSLLAVSQLKQYLGIVGEAAGHGSKDDVIQRVSRVLQRNNLTEKKLL
uniref:WGS project CAEQ00000000 data, annotated contig 905 n=1 Tax=Trypanosoma congolense (strain IL3000) TaxID=1068625 RepID=F9WJF9_TRYCI|nr:unnamed protein product [Trypanosoma congolense IL3000]